MGHDDFVADGFGDEVGVAAGLDETAGVAVAVGLGLGVCTTAGELCVLAGVGATGPSGPDGEGDGEETGGVDGVLAAVGVVPPLEVIEPATATPTIAATAVAMINNVALRVLIRDSADLRRGGRRTGFWWTDPA